MKRILVIDDDKIIVKLLVKVLLKEGYDVLHAMDGIDGLELARRSKPDLIILDYLLPRLDGLKISHLLKGDERYMEIPIILLSALWDDDLAEIVREEQVDKHFLKPVKMSDLLKEVAHLL